MERQRKERLVGAAVVVMLAVIFIPMVLDDSVQPEGGISGTNIPPRPEDGFSSRVVPLGSDAPVSAMPPAPAPAPAETTTPAAGTDATGAAGATAGAQETPGAPGAAPVAVQAPPAASGTASAPAPATPGSEAGVTAWVVQLGSFASEENANTLNRKLRAAGFSSFVEPLQQGGAKVFRVRVGPELRRSAAQSVRDRLKSGMELDGIVVPYP